MSKWARSIFSNSKILLHAALLVILHLDMAQDRCPLSLGEHDLRACLKRKLITLAIVERARKKQCTCIANIKEGDANTKFFHMLVNGQRRKNHIFCLKHNSGWVTGHGAKEEVILNHFKAAMGHREARTHDFNWEELDLENQDLHDNGESIFEEEVKNAINEMPSDKAPRPDGFTGVFFKNP
jgi:hypothetical protein